MTKSKLFFYFCLYFIVGIFLSSIISIPLFFLFGFLILAIILIFILRDYKKIIIIGFCLFFLVLGIWRNQTTELRIINNELRTYNDLGHGIVLIGTIIKEPDIREKNQKLTIKPKRIFFDNMEYEFENPGNVLVSYKKYPEYRYGDRLIIKGKLETPGIFEGFDYRRYLEKQGVYSVIYFSEIELLERGNFKNSASKIYAVILNFKDRLRKSIYENVSYTQSSILGAMILGDKSRLPNDLKEKLNIAGVRHITAVSGMHIAIISAILMSLLIGLGFWRSQAFYISIFFIFLFIVMIGAHPSSIRAGIMGGLYLLGQKVGRKSNSSRSIIMAAAIMLFFNPLLLMNDVGFQLSFLAVMGIIHLRPVLGKLLKFLPRKYIDIRDILAMTFSAYIFTLPILIYNFGRISLIAPLTNVLILPIIPLIMMFGFVFVLLGAIETTLGWLFSLPVWFLLSYLLLVVDLFSVSWFALTIENVHWIWLFISYFILGCLVFYLKKKERLKFLKF